MFDQVERLALGPGERGCRPIRGRSALHSTSSRPAGRPTTCVTGAGDCRCRVRYNRVSPDTSNGAGSGASRKRGWRVGVVTKPPRRSTRRAMALSTAIGCRVRSGVAAALVGGDGRSDGPGPRARNRLHASGRACPWTAMGSALRTAGFATRGAEPLPESPSSGRSPLWVGPNAQRHSSAPPARACSLTSSGLHPPRPPTIPSWRPTPFPRPSIRHRARRSRPRPRRLPGRAA